MSERNYRGIMGERVAAQHEPSEPPPAPRQAAMLPVRPPAWAWPVAGIAALAALVCIYALAAPHVAPLPAPTVGEPASATQPARAPAAAAPTGEATQAALIDAWWAPGGEAAPPVDPASIWSVQGRCYGSPLIQVNIAGGGSVWVDGEASGLSAALDLNRVNYAPGACSPPEPPAPPAPVVVVEPAPPGAVEVEVVTAAPQLPAPTPCGVPFTAAGCSNLVEVRP